MPEHVQQMKLNIESLQAEYDRLKSQGLNLNLTRGKPSTEQVALSDDLDGILEGDYFAEDGTDVRNYGGLRGIPEARAIGSILMDVPSENVICGGNASLQLMAITLDTIANYGLCGAPLKTINEATVLCPAPGYDRHFVLNESLGLRMEAVAIHDAGPDMDQVEQLVDDNPRVSAIWCVPKHSNPTGITYSDEVVERLARLPGRRKSEEQPFFVLWDNAYAVHDFDGNAELSSIYKHACKFGTEDRVVLFASTSKITHAGAGIAFLGGSENILNGFESRLSTMTVGPDKVNQLRHAKFLDNGKRLRAHMEAHAEIVRPKFHTVERVLNEQLGNSGLATWTQPTGGYFVSLDLQPGLAKQTVELCAEAGLAMTPAGATFPYKDDPNDSNIRIAPTFGKLEDIEPAITILGVSCKLAAAKMQAA